MARCSRFPRRQPIIILYAIKSIKTIILQEYITLMHQINVWLAGYHGNLLYFCVILKRKSLNFRSTDEMAHHIGNQLFISQSNN
jgi:hypothetical protein